MTRLYVVVEGQAEVNFVRDILKPHIEGRWPERLTVLPVNLKGGSLTVKSKS